MENLEKLVKKYYTAVDAKYSRTIKEIEFETGISIREKCAKCGKDAVRFTISLPKAGAILGMLGLYTGHYVSELGRFYGDYSRVLHPYGFYGYPGTYLINLWSIDFIRLGLKLHMPWNDFRTEGYR